MAADVGVVVRSRVVGVIARVMAIRMRWASVARTRDGRQADGQNCKDGPHVALPKVEAISSHGMIVGNSVAAIVDSRK
jgi:hypothetical protein